MLTSTSGKRPVEIVVFELDNYRCGLPAAQVRKIVRAVAQTPLPQVPPTVEGVVSIHGELVPIIDIRQRLGLSRRPVGVSDHLILAWTRDRLVGLRVDRVCDIMPIDAMLIDSIESLVPGAPYLSGVGRLPNGLILIYDLTNLLSSSEAEEISKSIESAVWSQEDR